MGRAARALVVSELIERARDRWVLVISLLFALLASGVSLYGRSAGASAAHLSGPSLVTLASLLVPLVALVLGHDAIVGERERNTLGLLLSLPIGKLEVAAAKFIGRLLALACALAIGIGAAIAVAPPGEGGVLLRLVGPSLLLGSAFLALGVLISALTSRQLTAASLAVAVWFVLAFFYDLGLLGLLVVTDGGVSQETVARLVIANPVGLFRLQMMVAFSGPEVLADLGVSVPAPGSAFGAGLWAGWIAGPVALSGLLLARQRSNR